MGQSRRREDDSAPVRRPGRSRLPFRPIVGGFVGAALVAAVALAAALVATLGAPLWVASLVAVNLATFVLYAYDKFAATSDWLRVPETALHVVALLGGTPAALAAHHLLRHKTLKRSFQSRFRLIVAVQVITAAAWTWYWFY